MESPEVPMLARRFFFVSLGVLALAVAYHVTFLSSIAADDAPQTIGTLRCQRMEVVNESGAVVAVLGHDSLGCGSLSLQDQNGSSRIVALVEANAGNLRLHSSQGKILIAMGPTARGDGLLTVDSKEGAVGVIARARLYGGGYLGINNHMENPVVLLEANDNDDGEIRVTDRNGSNAHVIR